MTEKLLPVPLHLQGINSSDCGPSCIAMILKYYKRPVKIGQLRSQLFYEKGGTFLFDNARLLLKRGFKVTIVTAHPMVFPADLIPRLKTKQDILRRLSVFVKKKPEYRDGIRLLRRYLRDGGQLRLEIPSLEPIKAAIGHGHPVMAVLHGGVLAAMRADSISW